MVLTGHKPEIILDVAGRALAFWQYQTAQELLYKELSIQALQDSNSELEKSLSQCALMAKAQIESLQEGFSKASKNLELEKRKNQEISEQLSEKSRQLKRLQANMEKLKRQNIPCQNGNAKSLGLQHSLFPNTDKTQRKSDCPDNLPFCQGLDSIQSRSLLYATPAYSSKNLFQHSFQSSRSQSTEPYTDITQ